jgi:hypothetical protein
MCLKIIAFPPNDHEDMKLKIILTVMMCAISLFGRALDHKGIVLDKVDFGGYRPSYLFMEESPLTKHPK